MIDNTGNAVQETNKASLFIKSILESIYIFIFNKINTSKKEAFREKTFSIA